MVAHTIGGMCDDVARGLRVMSEDVTWWVPLGVEWREISIMEAYYGGVWRSVHIGYDFGFIDSRYRTKRGQRAHGNKRRLNLSAEGVL